MCLQRGNQMKQENEIFFTLDEFEQLIRLVGDHLDDLMGMALFEKTPPNLQEQVSFNEDLMDKLMDLVQQVYPNAYQDYQIENSGGSNYVH